jgi:hypothetical protein
MLRLYDSTGDDPTAMRMDVIKGDSSLRLRVQHNGLSSIMIHGKIVFTADSMRAAVEELEAFVAYLGGLAAVKRMSDEDKNCEEATSNEDSETRV